MARPRSALVVPMPFCEPPPDVVGNLLPVFRQAPRLFDSLPGLGLGQALPWRMLRRALFDPGQETWRASQQQSLRRERLLPANPLELRAGLYGPGHIVPARSRKRIAPSLAAFGLAQRGSRRVPGAAACCQPASSGSSMDEPVQPNAGAMKSAADSPA